MNQAVRRTARTQSVNKRKLTRLIGLLRDGDNFEKEKVVEMLTSSPDKKTVESVVPLLYEDSTGVRMAAHEILKKAGSLAIEKIIDLLDSENEDIRVYACEILASIGDKRALPYIIKKIYSDEDNVRNAACIALGEFREKEAVKALLDALKDDEWIVFSAIYSLGKIRDTETVGPLLDLFRHAPDELSAAACEVLVDFDDETIMDEIFSCLRQWDSAKRSMCLKIILEKGNEQSFQMWKEKIGDELFEHLLSGLREDKKKSIEFIKMLTHFRNKRTCDAVLSALRDMDPDGDELNESLEMFASLSDIWGEHIDEYMGWGEEYLLPVMKACRMTGVKIKEPLLLKVFSPSPVELKRELIVILPDIVEGDGRTIVLEGMNDVDGHIKGDAVVVAGRMNLIDLKDRVAEIAKEGFIDVRVKALKVLVTFDLHETLKIVTRFVHDGSADDKKVFLSIAHLLDSGVNFPFIERLLADPDEGVRRNSISVIGNFINDGRYLRFLDNMLSDASIPHEVLKVIKEKKLYEFKDRLIGIFNDESKGLWTRYYALAALGVFNDHSLFDIFVQGLDDSNNLIKIACIKALADLKDSKAAAFIRPFMGDPDEDVRSTADLVVGELDNLLGDRG